MKSKKKIIGGFFLANVTALSVIAAALMFSNKNNDIIAQAQDHHEGYHYAEVLATSSSKGNAEIYTCCLHHEVYTASTKPSDTDFTYEDRLFSHIVGDFSKYEYYFVNLNDNGGSNGSGSLNKVQKDSNLPNVTIPTYAHHAFKGYFTNASGGDQYIDSNGNGVKAFDLDNNVTLYAQWEVAHSYVKVEEVPATIVSTGVAEHYTCTGCNKIFKLVDGSYIETTKEALVIAKKYATWNETIDFNTYCTNGDSSERVSASVMNGKLRFTNTGSLHYGEYRSAYEYQITKSDTKKYKMAINGITWSDGCDVDKANKYPGKFNIFVYNNNDDRVCAYDYWYNDSNATPKDLTDYVNKYDVNNVKIVIQCIFGNNGNNKKDEYVEIDSIVMITENIAPSTKTFETGTYDIPSMLAGATNHDSIKVNTSDGKLTLSTVDTGKKYGNVLAATTWTTDAIENSYIKFNIDSITGGGTDGLGRFHIQLVNFDGTTTTGYIIADQTQTGSYEICLASRDFTGKTGTYSFKFIFCIGGGTDVTVVFSSIELIKKA